MKFAKTSTKIPILLRAAPIIKIASKIKPKSSVKKTMAAMEEENKNSVNVAESLSMEN